MSSPLALAHIEAEKRLRVAVRNHVAQVWKGLPGYDRANVDQWLTEVLPMIEAAQRSSVTVTQAYLARALDRPPAAVNLHELIGSAVRNGAAPAEVYTRPFVTLWSELGEGTPWADASSMALSRAAGIAATDVQLSMRDTLSAVGSAESAIYGYERAADAGACNFCLEVDGAYVGASEPMPLHNGCGCGVEVLESAHKGAVRLPDGQVVRDYQYGPEKPTPLPGGVAIAHHGELGPVLVDPSQHYMTEAEAQAR
jgi:hypothetical protein